MSDSSDKSNRIEANNSNNNNILQHIIKSVVVIINGCSLERIKIFSNLIKSVFRYYHWIFWILVAGIEINTPSEYFPIEYRVNAVFWISFLQSLLALIPIFDILINILKKHTK